MMRKWPIIAFLLFMPIASLSASSIKVEQIFALLAKQSGLEAVKSLNLRFVSPSQLEEAYLRDFWQRHPLEVLRQESQFLKLAGILKENVDLIQQFERLVKGNIKAYYLQKDRVLLIDRTLSFEDDFALGPLVAEAWKVLTDRFSGDAPSPGPFFSDSNWQGMFREIGEATFVMHRFFEEDLDLYTGPDGVMSTTRNPLISMATGYDFDPIIGCFYSQSLTLGAQEMAEAFRKKEWKGLAAHLKKPDKPLGERLQAKSDKEKHAYPFLNTPPLDGFKLLEKRLMGIFLEAYFLKRQPQELWNGFGARGDVCAIYQNDVSGGSLLRWESEWRGSDAARDVFLILRDRFESDLACRFELSSRRDGPFLAGRDMTGAYVFLYQGQNRTLLVRSFDRQAINRFIANGAFAGN